MTQHSWRKSSYSGEFACVELASAGERVLVRNSNTPDAGTLSLTRGQLAGLIGMVKAGELDDLA